MSKKKRVVIDASSCMIGSWNPHLSGIGRTVLELIRALENRKNLPFDLSLFCQRFSNDRLQRYHFSSKQYCLPLPRKSYFEILKNKLPIVETITRADLYHIPHNHSGFFYNNRTILTIHDALMFILREDRLYRPEERIALKKDAERCKAILTCSQSSKQLLLEYLDIPEEKITVTPWGYNDQIFFVQDKSTVQNELHNRLGLSVPFLLSVSCSNGRKRTPELIRQYLKTAKNDFPYDLVVVWRNPSDEVKSMLQDNPIKHRVKIISSVSDEELSYLYNGASCTVFPSIHEGFGLPLLESMACGTPVMTTNATSLPEIAGDAGIYFDSLEEESIGVKLQQLAENCFNLADFSKKSLEQAARFSWDQCAEKTIEVYQKVLA